MNYFTPATTNIDHTSTPVLPLQRNTFTMATDDIQIPQHVGLSEAPRDVEAIKKHEKAALLPHWDSGIAFKLGYNLRTRLLTFERPAVVDISTISTPGHVLFHAVSTMIDAYR